jgi:small subunit ribosomal protein S16
MLRIRLQRRGKKNYATYRVVVADRTSAVDGRFVADLGFYNPHSKAFSVTKEVAQTWLSKGAQPSPTVHNLFVSHKLVEAKKVTAWRPKKHKKEE